MNGRGMMKTCPLVTRSGNHVCVDVGGFLIGRPIGYIYLLNLIKEVSFLGSP